MKDHLNNPKGTKRSFGYPGRLQIATQQNKIAGTFQAGQPVPRTRGPFAQPVDNLGGIREAPGILTRDAGKDHLDNLGSTREA